jgi:hypothetical protein
VIFRDFGNTGACPCDEEGAALDGRGRFHIGFVEHAGRYGEVSIDNCTCGRFWLCLERIDAKFSGLWVRALIDPHVAKALSATESIEYLTGEHRFQVGVGRRGARKRGAWTDHWGGA